MESWVGPIGLGPIPSPHQSSMYIDKSQYFKEYLNLFLLSVGSLANLFTFAIIHFLFEVIQMKMHFFDFFSFCPIASFFRISCRLTCLHLIIYTKATGETNIWSKNFRKIMQE